MSANVMLGFGARRRVCWVVEMVESCVVVLYVNPNVSSKRSQVDNGRYMYGIVLSR
jgi:hypothetical protein